MTLMLNGDISDALGFLLAGVYGSAACMGVVYLMWRLTRQFGRERLTLPQCSGMQGQRDHCW
jgi:hypothetical protein